jgi:hypothetical protein
MLKAARPLHLLWIAALLLAGCSPTSLKLNPYGLNSRPVPLALGEETVSFRELVYDTRLKQVLVPAAEAGQLLVLDPASRAIKQISGFSQRSPEGVALGATSAVSDGRLLYALDRTARQIRVVDPGSGEAISSTPVESFPEYIRYVPSTNELWVTEPQAEQIEIYRLVDGRPGAMELARVLEVEAGPENLVFYRRGGLAFTNQPNLGLTKVFSVSTKGELDSWGNGCSQARGMSVDEERGYLFIACAEGKLVMLDILNNGFPLASLSYGGDLSTVVYNQNLRHIYLPSSASAILGIFEVAQETQSTTAADGYGSSAAAQESGLVLRRLGTADTAVGAHCVTVDDQDNIWVCDPVQARLFVIKDTFPKSD